MKFSISWLKTYLQYSENIDVVLDCLNDLGLEVESVEDPTNIYRNFIVGRIDKVEMLISSKCAKFFWEKIPKK